MTSEKLNAIAETSAKVIRGSGSNEAFKLNGVYTAKCYDKDGNLKWEDTIDNVVCTVGKNELLDVGFEGSGYTVTGPYMGLISSVGWSAVAAGDTMSSHGGWNEAGTGVNYPLYTGDRKTCVWSSASGGAKSLSSALSFVCETTGGTVKGCFIVFGTGAVATKGDTNGILFSAGTFTGGDKILDVDDTLNVSYTINT